MEKIYVYGLGERIWHWLQALCIAVLLISGLLIHFITVDGISLKTLYDWHSVFGFILILNTFIGNIYFLSNHRVTQFIPIVNSQFIDGFVDQIKYYMKGRFKGEHREIKKTIREKLNPLQKVTYFGMLFVILPLQMISGVFLFYNSSWAGGINSALGGFGVVSTAHTIISYVFLSFLVVHIYLTFLTKPFYKNYVGIITGFETVPEEGAK